MSRFRALREHLILLAEACLDGSAAMRHRSQHSHGWTLIARCSSSRLVRHRVFRSLLLWATLLAVISAVYGPVLHGWFIADDFRWLEISTFEDVARSFLGPWGHGASYRPLPRVSFLMDSWLFGYGFPGRVSMNLVLHSVNSLVLYHLSASLVRPRLAPLCLTLLFSLSPLAHENVAWISGRTHLLAALFVLLSLLALCRRLQAGQRRLWVPAALFFLALLSYEAAVYTLAFLPIILIYAARTSPLATSSIVRTAGSFVTAFILYLALRAVAL